MKLKETASRELRIGVAKYQLKFYLFVKGTLGNLHEKTYRYQCM